MNSGTVKYDDEKPYTTCRT